VKIDDISKTLLEVSNMNYNVSEEVLSKNIKQFILKQAFY